MPPHCHAVLLFTKEPVVGQVKTRLVPPLSPAEAADLAAAFVADLTSRLAALDARLVLALPPGTSEEAFVGLVTRGWTYAAQGDGDLGRKLARATTGEFDRGATAVAVIGADHPDLPLALLEGTLRSAQAGRVGWVTTTDGGYACIALPRPMPSLFEAVPWSTTGVAAAMRNNARHLGVLLEESGPWYDLDTPDDVERFLAGPDAAEICPATWQVIASLRPPWEERRRTDG